MYYYYIEFTSQHILVTGNFNLYVHVVANESQFMCICTHHYVDLSPISFIFITINM